VIDWGGNDRRLRQGMITVTLHVVWIEQYRSAAPEKPIRIAP
jgi:hypothetical protein